jgi:SPP1 gp7 family putative phage head morphogenesis protein
MSIRLLHSAAIQHHVGDLLARNLAAANILGRSQIVRDVHRKTGIVVPFATSSRLPVHFAEGDDDDTAGAIDANAGFSVDLPATEQAEYLRGLTAVTKATFDGLSQQYRKLAFTVAGVSDVRLIQKIRDTLAEVTQRGGTKADFDKAVRQLTTDAGVQQLNAFTLDTVFQTNMQKAFSLGRYEQLTHPAVVAALPFWQYMTVGDDRVRPEHRVLDGFVAQATDPVWNKIYPPNGFNCRCIVIAILREQALAIDKNAAEDGYMRLPALAIALVPQVGFHKVFEIAA